MFQKDGPRVRLSFYLTLEYILRLLFPKSRYIIFINFLSISSTSFTKENHARIF